MTQAVLFEDSGWVDLLPLVYWRHVSELRCGALTLGERACDRLSLTRVGRWCRAEWADLVADRAGASVNRPALTGTLLVNARWLVTERPTVEPPPSVGQIGDTPVYVHCDEELARSLSAEEFVQGRAGGPLSRVRRRHEVAGRLIRFPWDLVHANQEMLEADCSGGGIEGRICDGAHLLNPSAIRVGAGAVVKPGAVLDAESGPIRLDRDAVVSPNATLQGPCYVGAGTIVQPAAVVRSGTSIGPVCKVGGEMEASIIHGHANKQHDGFLGHSYVCEWVNLGADTVTSDLKNTYGTVRVPLNGREIDSGETFVGLFVGDHSKTGINQAFSTGTVVGFGCNVATSAFPPKFIPSFSWLTDAGRADFDPVRCLDVARKVMRRRQTELTPTEQALFLRLPEIARRHEAPGS